MAANIYTKSISSRYYNTIAVTGTYSTNKNDSPGIIFLPYVLKTKQYNKRFYNIKYLLKVL